MPLLLLLLLLQRTAISVHFLRNSKFLSSRFFQLFIWSGGSGAHDISSYHLWFEIFILVFILWFCRTAIKPVQAAFSYFFFHCALAGQIPHSQQSTHTHNLIQIRYILMAFISGQKEKVFFYVFEIVFKRYYMTRRHQMHFRWSVFPKSVLRGHHTKTNSNEFLFTKFRERHFRNWWTLKNNSSAKFIPEDCST